MHKKYFLLLFILIITHIAAYSDDLIQEESGKIPEPPEFTVTMLKINEIRSTGDFDFIEIYNTAPYAVMFPEGWYLLDGKLDYDEALPIPANTIIGSNSYLLIIPDNEFVTAAFPEGIPVIYAYDSFGFGLKANDEVRLMYNKNSREIMVDILGWGGAANSWGFLPDGSSELYDNLVPTPGAPNQVYPDSVKKIPTLRINEIQTKETSVFSYDFIELYNYGSDTVSCKDITVTDGNGSPVMELPEELTLDPGEYCVLVPNEFDPITFSGQNIILNSSSETTFGLGKSDSVFIYFQGTVIDSLSWEDGHHTSIGLMGTDTLYWEKNLAPTPGSSNKNR
ncbi:MAG: lamin tail domain-containing protein [Spirochaetia bacterium]|nr:lamin tail domain-containing protein [Spirochaetia bacterium]